MGYTGDKENHLSKQFQQMELEYTLHYILQTKTASFYDLTRLKAGAFYKLSG